MSLTIAIPEPSRHPLLASGRESQAIESREPAHVEVARSRYRNLVVELDPADRTYWCFMRPEGRPSFTPDLIRDASEMQRALQRLFAERSGEPQTPCDYYISGSAIPGIFNLGGDLRLFREAIRSGDRAGLRRYGRACIEIAYRTATAFDLPVITIALIQGDALGGGFESALAHDLIIAERQAKMGLPEILFNLFPGMGAYSFLSRRVGVVTAERMITSGRLYTAEEMHEAGVVDILAEPGRGVEAVRSYVQQQRRRHATHQALYQVRRRVNPVTIEELHDVVDIWVDTALKLGEADLKKMERLTAAQDRRQATIAAPIAAE